MNIKEAKEEVRNAVFAYFTKDEFGGYEIPIERQRPLFLMGPPGIGKTAIMEQISQELGVGLVSYSMSHHTRQSALGLPYITTKVYDGREVSVSEYTMSEIISSVFDLMADTGLKEGILFLDEVNCVSETLAPAMLQFLQYKTFGKYQVPEGWVVVTAGNPPEYNNSVREMDIVTWDRLKRIDIVPDYAAWKEYAVNIGVHPAITTYLDIKKNDFYEVETTADGKTFVTARGWVDLSSMMRIYEQRGFKITERLVRQYLQNDRISRDFAIYYDLFNKYKSDYQVENILSGNLDGDTKTRARQADPDERLSLLGLLLDNLTGELRAVCFEEDALTELVPLLKNTRALLTGSAPDDQAAPMAPVEALSTQEAEVNRMIENGKRASTLSPDRQYVLNTVLNILNEQKGLFEGSDKSGDEAFAIIKSDFAARTAALKEKAKTAENRLSNLFTFCENMFGMDGEGNSREMIILVTELTLNMYSARFISRYGCDKYFAHSDQLNFHERQLELIEQLEE